MDYLLPIICCAGSFFWGFYIGRTHPKSFTSAPLSRARTTIHFRVAVHEAGHAVVGRHNPYVRLTRIKMEEGVSLGAGKTHYMTNPDRGRTSSEAAWWDAAFSLGGLIAELIELKNMRSGNCLSDLEHVREIISDIVIKQHLKPPWPIVASNGSFDIRSVYKKGSLSLKEEQVLIQAYAKARAIIVQDKNLHGQIVLSLLEKGELVETDIQKLMG